MEAGELREQAEYESYIEDIKAGRNYSEALEVAVGAAGTIERKGYQEKLLEVVLDKISSERPNVDTSLGIGFVRRLESNYSRDSNHTDFDNMDLVMEKIAQMPGAHPYAKKLALESIFEHSFGKINANTFNIIKTTFISPERSKKDTFESSAIDMAIKFIQEHPRSRAEKGSPTNDLYRLIVEEMVKGNIDEGTTRSFVRDLKKEWETSQDIEFLVMISKSPNIATDINDIAKSALRK